MAHMHTFGGKSYPYLHVWKAHSVVELTGQIHCSRIVSRKPGVYTGGFFCAAVEASFDSGAGEENPCCISYYSDPSAIFPV